MPTRRVLIALPLALLAAAMLAFTQPAPATTDQPTPTPQAQSPDTRVIFIVRHADTDSGAGRDPDLTQQGLDRANRLAQTLADELLDAVYVTDTNRSRQTAEPIAKARTITPTQYPATDPKALAAMLGSLPEGANALVIAHSNTVPFIIRQLGGPKLDEIPHDDFSRLYALVLTDHQHTRTISLHY